MRKVADIGLCVVCITIVDGDPAMCDGRMQADCAEAAPKIAENWPGYNLHGTEGEPWTSSAECDGCGNPSQGERHPAVVLAPEYKLTNVSNPAAFGVEWVAGENGNTYQLSNPRGTTALMFGTRHAGKTEWLNTTVTDPSRFGMTSAPRTFKAFSAIAYEYVNGDQS